MPDQFKIKITKEILQLSMESGIDGDIDKMDKKDKKMDKKNDKMDKKTDKK